MIKRESIFPLIVDICPDFKPEWEEFVNEWEKETDNLPYYHCLSNFSRFLIKKLSSDDVSNFDSIFNLIEKLHNEGDSYVRTAATIGILESLQNLNLHKANTKPDDFYKYLQPTTKKMWHKVYDFWEKGIIITED